MKEQFVTYEIAKMLKEKSFNEYCFSAYRNTDGEKSLMGLSKWKNGEVYDNHEGFAAAPIWQQVEEWLRKKHNIYIYIERDGGWWIVNIKDLSKEEEEGTLDIKLKNEYSNCFNDLFKAKEITIKYVLTII